jgi:ectoine hydroxylase-related dioxygenase (phytanoyl-CoA dioxygenase family)
LLAPAKQLEEWGFVIIPEVLQPEILDELAAAIGHAQGNRDVKSAHGVRNLLRAVPAVRRVCEGDAIRALVEPLLGSNAFVARSLLFDKTPDANWKVAWHQDLTIAVQARIEVPGFSVWSVKDGVVHVQPPVALLERMLTVRLHLDDCGPSNGPLQVIPGSHKYGRLEATQISEWRTRQPTTICPVPPGGALLMRPMLLHASSRATQPGHRRVVHLEFASEPLPNGLQWHQA